MVDDDIADGVSAQGVVAVGNVGFAAAEAQVANDDVMRVDADSGAANADAVAGRRLTGDGDVGGADTNTILEMNDAGDIEDDDARANGIARFPQGALTCVFETG